MSIVDTLDLVQNIIEGIDEHHGLEDEDILHPLGYKNISQHVYLKTIRKKVSTVCSQC